MLPAEPALAAQLKVSRNTVRAAYAILEREGLIERKHGKGTMVVSKTPRGAKKGRIGLVFFSSGELMFTVPFYGRLIQRLYALGRNVGWHVALMTHDPRRPGYRYDWREHEYRLKEFEAMVLLGVFRPEAVETLGGRMPVVAVDAGGRFRSADSAVCDDLRAGLLATEHLIRLGHKRIAFLGQTEPGEDGVLDPAHAARYEGYRRAMERAKIAVTEDLLLDTQTSDRGAAHAMRGAIERGEVPSAVVAVGDSSAMAAMEAARRAGIRVPESMSFVGMGNEQSTHGGLSLTSVELHPEQMAEQAVRLLQRRIEDPEVSNEHLVVDVELVERTSSVPPALISIIAARAG